MKGLNQLDYRVKTGKTLFNVPKHRYVMKVRLVADVKEFALNTAKSLVQDLDLGPVPDPILVRESADLVTKPTDVVEVPNIRDLPRDAILEKKG